MLLARKRWANWIGAGLVVGPGDPRQGWAMQTLTLLLGAVERARKADPDGWQGRADARLLATLTTLALDRIPRDPLAATFRQGNTLGAKQRHWFRAKFGGNRFRLFFRADSRAKVIVYAWVNDRGTLRQAGATTDPYAVFAGTLAGGNPPGDWPALLAAAPALATARRFGVVDRQARARRRFWSMNSPEPRHPHPTGTRQSRSAYSRMARSLENQPMPAVLRTAMAVQAAGSAQSASRRRWASQ